uniref:Uncharacterized protein n=1 Tax=Rhizophora mucronata TaxID=61149 RepID=A0A2P2NH55_RHIMU
MFNRQNYTAIFITTMSVHLFNYIYEEMTQQKAMRNKFSATDEESNNCLAQ